MRVAAHAACARTREGWHMDDQGPPLRQLTTLSQRDKQRYELEWALPLDPPRNACHAVRSGTAAAGGDRRRTRRGRSRGAVGFMDDPDRAPRVRRRDQPGGRRLHPAHGASARRDVKENETERHRTRPRRAPERRQRLIRRRAPSRSRSAMAPERPNAIQTRTYQSRRGGNARTCLGLYCPGRIHRGIRLRSLGGRSGSRLRVGLCGSVGSRRRPRPFTQVERGRCALAHPVGQGAPSPSSSHHRETRLRGQAIRH